MTELANQLKKVLQADKYSIYHDWDALTAYVQRLILEARIDEIKNPKKYQNPNIDNITQRLAELTKELERL